MPQTIPLAWSESQLPDGTQDRRPQIPVPDGHYLAWSSVDEASGKVAFETAPIPDPLPDPEPEPEPPAE